MLGREIPQYLLQFLRSPLFLYRVTMFVLHLLEQSLLPSTVKEANDLWWDAAYSWSCASSKRFNGLVKFLLSRWDVDMLHDR